MMMMMSTSLWWLRTQIEKNLGIDQCQCDHKAVAANSILLSIKSYQLGHSFRSEYGHRIFNVKLLGNDTFLNLKLIIYNLNKG
jgi:hypothetical protein